MRIRYTHLYNESCAKLFLFDLESNFWTLKLVRVGKTNRQTIESKLALEWLY